MKLAKTVALCTAALIVSAQAAQSADFRGLIQGMAGRYVTSWEDLDAKRADLSTQIDAAVRTGELTSTQAKDFRDSLAKLALEETQAKAGGRRISFVQSMQFSNELTALATALQDAAGKAVATLPDVDALRAKLSMQIDTALAAGHMTATTATGLKAELQRQADIEAAYKAEAGGTLTNRQIELLADQLKTTEARIDQEVKVGQSAAPMLTEKRVAIETRITAAVTAGKLSAADAEMLRVDLHKVAAEQNQFQTAGGGVLTGTQVLRIAQRLDAVEDTLTAKTAAAVAVTPGSTVPPGSTLPGTQTAADLDRYSDMVASRLQSAMQSGGLTPQVSAHATQELDDIRKAQRVYERQPGGITQLQIAELRGRLRDLQRFVRQQVATDQERNNWSDVTLGAGMGAGMGMGMGAGAGAGMDVGMGGRHGGMGGAYGGGMDGRGGMRHGGMDGRGGMGGPGMGNDMGAGMPNDNLPGNTQVSTLPVQISSAFNVGSLPVINTKALTDLRGYWGEQYVAELSSRGVIGGFPDGSFKPNDEITRAQFAAIVAKALNLGSNPSGANFRDVPQNYWGAGAIGAAVSAGLIGGYPDGSYRPEDKITRAQALVILSKAVKNVRPNPAALNAYTDANVVPGWARNDVATAASAGIIVSFPDAAQIKPSDNATRGEVAGLMYQTLRVLGGPLPIVKIGTIAQR